MDRRPCAASRKRLDDTQLILVCGHNCRAGGRIARDDALGPRAPWSGFTSQIRYFMQLSDFFIGKPGPGSISEAVQQRLPVIVVRNAWTMPQERYNTEWVEENDAGVVLDSFKDIRAGRGRRSRAGSMLIAPASQRIQNRAIFEIPDILERILRLSDAGSGRRRFHPAFPGRPAPASVPGSIRAAAARTRDGAAAE